MALYVINDLNEIDHLFDSPYRIFETREGVQRAFCNAIENEIRLEKPFLTNRNVEAYLLKFGVTYKGNYLFQCDDWVGMGTDDSVQFVTYLNYTLQLGCLAIYEQNTRIVIAAPYLYDLNHLLPVLEKKDVYIVEKTFLNVWKYMQVIQKGIEIIIAGVSSRGKTENEMKDFLMSLRQDAGYLNREIDSIVFDANAIKIFHPFSQTLLEFVASYGVENQNFFEEIVSKNKKFKDTIVKVNGRSNFNGTFRRYPIHFLFLIHGEWKYISDNSVKNPCYMELLNEAVLNPEPFDIMDQRHVDVSDAEKVFALILDCDEICDVSHYWEHICFLAKFDKVRNELEICDQNAGVLEFHELWQESGDM